MLRWSDAWEVASLTRMREKWRLDDDGYFANRISNRGWRRNLAIWRPVANTLSFGRQNRLLSRALFAFDRFVLNHFISERYRRRYGERTVLEPTVRLSKAQQTETGARRSCSPMREAGCHSTSATPRQSSNELKS